MDGSVRAYLHHLKAERRRSAHTVRSYEHDLGLYCRYLREVFGEEADPAGADPVRLRRYSAWLTGQGYAASTVARRLASLRSFFRYLRRQRLGLAQTRRLVFVIPSSRDGLPRLLRVDDVIRLLDAIPTDTPPSVRDRAMLETLYGGGLRVSELVGLNLDDLDFDQELVRVRGKGRRERLCPIGEMAVHWLKRWIPLRKPEARRRKSAVSQPARHALDLAERRPAAGGTLVAGGLGRMPPARTRSDTVSPPTCSTAGPTSGACRSCSAIEN